MMPIPVSAATRHKSPGIQNAQRLVPSDRPAHMRLMTWLGLPLNDLISSNEKKIELFLLLIDPGCLEIGLELSSL